MAEIASSMAVGTHLFVSSETEVWQEAVVDSISDGKVFVRVKGAEPGELVELKGGNKYHPHTEDRFNTPSGYPDDLCNLTYLHEASVLHALDCRFSVDDIYTLTGKILIAVNPFKTIKGLYDDETIVRYLELRDHGVPHVFGVARDAYNNMTKNEQSQTILISGESGAGKTESTKFAMKFLAIAGAESMEKKSPAEVKVLESNPLLESFGNASTVRNANSSRFGKFIELQYRKESPIKARLVGARIETYLLEKVRICQQQDGERNYHIFHQLTAAATRGDKYSFAHPESSGAQSGTPWEFDLAAFRGSFRIVPADSERDFDLPTFDETLAALRTVGFSQEQVRVVFDIVATVLHLSNIEFVEKGSEGAMISNMEAGHCQTVTTLLNVDSVSLMNALMTRTIKTANEMYTKPLRVDEACDVRDAIAKNVYSMLFDHLVERVNESIGYVPDANLTTGILDIFGFECFKHNSFEQLCINFTNETLQNFFNNFVFRCEEELYSAEGISWNALDFPDNSDCVDLFKSRPYGLFAMIDEECNLPGGRDQSLCNKVVQRHSNNARFAKVKLDQSSFVVNHFAGAVQYKIDGFLEKNKDQLSNDAVSFILSTKIDEMRSIFQSYIDKKASTVRAGGRAGGVTKQKTICTQFSGQLDSLMTKIGATNPHFIRCIKPSPECRPNHFDRKTVDSQLRCSGMLQVVQVSRAGYPVRFPHAELFHSFRYLLEAKEAESALNIEDKRKQGEFVLDILVTRYMTSKPPEEGSLAIGKTLIFMKNGPYEQVCLAMQSLRNSRAIVIQARVRRNIQRRRYLEALWSIRTFQIWVRYKIKKLQRQRAIRTQAILLIQSMYRMYVQRKLMRELRDKVSRLQSLWRSVNSRVQTEEKRIHTMATKLQAAWKGYKCRCYYLELRSATIKAQLRWRSICARRTLRSLRMEAKDLGNVIKRAQALEEDLKKEKAMRADAEARVLQLTAKLSTIEKSLEELKGRVESLTKERDGLAERLHEAETNTQKAQTDLRMIKEFVSKEAVSSSQSDWLSNVLGGQGGDKAPGDSSAAAAAPRTGSIKSDKPSGRSIRSPPGTRTRSIEQTADIVLCGPPGCGKTRLLEMALIKKGDDKNLELLRSADEARSRKRRVAPAVFDFAVNPGHPISVTEIPGSYFDSDEARTILRNAHLVAICFDPGNQQTYEDARVIVKMLKQLVDCKNTRICLVQNDYIILESARPIVCDINQVQTFAVENELLYMRIRDLMEFVEQVTAYVEGKRGQRAAGANDGSKSGRTPNRGALSLFYEKFRNFWAGVNYSGFQNKLLVPTLVAQEGYKLPPLSLKRVAAIYNYTAAVTCLAFRPEDPSDPYIVLAVGRRDGTINLYHCFRTETELLALNSANFDESEPHPVNDNVMITESFTLAIHTKAVTCMCFSKVEVNELVTTSVDCTIRAWNVMTGQLIKVFNDSDPGLAVMFHPVDPTLFICCNANPTMRIIHYNQGTVLQKIRTKSELRCLVFDDTRFNCIAGNERGAICIYEAQADLHLKLSTTKSISRGPVTCVNFVPSPSPDVPPCIIANVCSGQITILNCLYEGSSGKISEITYRYTVNNAHVALPVRSCYSRFGGGWCISGSEDRNLLIFSLLEENMPYTVSFHQGPVVAVAVNRLDTLLVTSDSKGSVAFWRRVLVSSKA
ncbi:WD40 repeat myosin-like protein, putative [Babesia bigemina]|uniref:WD40 repeat myosin-like protein, putative n=1 Tax=Babesia bigemina TaxID=5866 RepID=A0A061D3C1_BABBI|nr:WD40 repeat myosin-like protein, putative [Babesia bigemina]CDR94582.1 WD40 repeat myosin-like protein, putative [Babesia bigemina]|eukprot:XP_012766768.1 WD40 repeat myosin-like protein, putative [Babesia bigemina]